MHAKGEIGVGEKFLHRSIIDSVFAAEITGLSKVGGYDAVIPAVSGRSWITAKSTYILERDDPYPTGYAITDTWPALKPGLHSVTAKEA